MSEWQPIETAPRDGTDIQARIPGNGEDNVIAWQAGAFLDSDGHECGGWAFTSEQEPPDCWTDGICWEVNENGAPSVQPTHWRPLPPAPPTDATLLADIFDKMAEVVAPLPGDIAEMLAEIERHRASLPPEERERIEREENQAQRESWVRAMAPCEHGDPDWETCAQCRGEG